MENPTNNTPGTEIPSMTPAPKEGGMGALIGIVIIVLILAAGGIYVWMSKNTTKQAPQTNQGTEQQAAAPEDAKTQALMQASSSDSASAIEADLKATDTGNASNDLQLQ